VSVGRPMTIERPWPKQRSGPQVRAAKADAQAMVLAPIIVEIRASGATTLQEPYDANFFLGSEKPAGGHGRGLSRPWTSCRISSAASTSGSIKSQGKNCEAVQE
jgi:hypothetical protein